MASDVIPEPNLRAELVGGPACGNRIPLGIWVDWIEVPRISHTGRASLVRYRRRGRSRFYDFESERRPPRA